MVMFNHLKWNRSDKFPTEKFWFLSFNSVYQNLVFESKMAIFIKEIVVFSKKLPFFKEFVVFDSKMWFWYSELSDRNENFLVGHLSDLFHFRSLDITITLLIHISIVLNFQPSKMKMVEFAQNRFQNILGQKWFLMMLGFPGVIRKWPWT